MKGLLLAPAFIGANKDPKVIKSVRTKYIGGSHGLQPVLGARLSHVVHTACLQIKLSNEGAKV